ncbi:MAG: hypothetical protein WBG81_06040 [Rhodanobacter sp.]
MAENRTVTGHVANGTRIARADSGINAEGTSMYPCRCHRFPDRILLVLLSVLLPAGVLAADARQAVRPAVGDAIGSALNGGNGHLGVSGDDIGNVAAQAANEGGNPAVL